MIFLSKFFCKENEYEPVGMFSVGHIVTLIIFLLIVAFCAYKCRKIGKDKAIEQIIHYSCYSVKSHP